MLCTLPLLRTPPCECSQHEGAVFPCIVRKKPQVPNTARQAASLPGSDHYPIAALFELTGSADPDAPQAPGNYGDLTEENFPCDDYNEPPQTGAGYEDMTEEDYLLQ